VDIIASGIAAPQCGNYDDDLGAEKLMAAEKEGRKIAVEVKSFTWRSEMNDLEKAVGQYKFRKIILFSGSVLLK
jgi:hypothetical protein